MKASATDEQAKELTKKFLDKLFEENVWIKIDKE